MDNLFGDLRLGGRRRTRGSAFQAATEYTARWGWTVAAGAGRTAADGRCGCGAVHCAAPGLHDEVSPHVTAAPGGGLGPHAASLRELWSMGSPLLLLPGRTFDVLDVPAQPGLQALVRLERMGTQLGPVLAPPTGRLLFFTAPGTAARLPELLYRMGWDDAALDLACHGEGTYLAAPPTALGPLGPTRWLRRPTRESAATPPEARLLLGTLAYTCHRGRERAPELAS
ncbi:DNA primase [Kitasatospora sp. MMS16-BH015]|uniref:bifunctional DNA primase/polymerase n=1 Tax=Kitasatospora sp. MMS16-BH015 TaxID=2018025 RepID=UPI000CA1E5FD|nr:bifunctional DNA primase/polymerase [Kitasatospora sp. MMS16-BH015]AUG79853.1 DNA primase [Kitasatospora sp. MMS16-BH015]